MVDEPAPTGEPSTDEHQALLRLTDEVIGLSAELGELRSKIDLATERSRAAAEVAQHADVTANASADQVRAFGEYLEALTDGLGARSSAPTQPQAAELAALPRDELIARIEHLEAVLSRRSVRLALGVTQKLRGS